MKEPKVVTTAQVVVVAGEHATTAERLVTSHGIVRTQKMKMLVVAAGEAEKKVSVVVLTVERLDISQQTVQSHLAINHATTVERKDTFPEIAQKQKIRSKRCIIMSNMFLSHSCTGPAS